MGKDVPGRGCPAIISHGMVWTSGETRLAAAEPMGKLVGTWGVQWCHLGEAERSIMGIPNWVLRRSRNPNSRDQVNLPPASWQVSKAGAKAQGLTGSEYVHSFNNIY